MVFVLVISTVGACFSSCSSTAARVWGPSHHGRMLKKKLAARKAVPIDAQAGRRILAEPGGSPFDVPVLGGRKEVVVSGRDEERSFGGETSEILSHHDDLRFGRDDGGQVEEVAGHHDKIEAICSQSHFLRV